MQNCKITSYKMKITSAKYGKGQDDKNCCVKATIDGKEMFVPIDENNRHYAEIKAQVDAGILTIEDAD